MSGAGSAPRPIVTTGIPHCLPMMASIEEPSGGSRGSRANADSCSGTPSTSWTPDRVTRSAFGRAGTKKSSLPPEAEMSAHSSAPTLPLRVESVFL